MHPLVAKLQGTDQRSIGRSEEVARDVLAHPGQFRLVFDAMLVPDPVVRMRAADAVEKITRRRPGLLRGLEDRVLTEVAGDRPAGGPLACRPAAAAACPDPAAAGPGN